jgi:transposase
MKRRCVEHQIIEKECPCCKAKNAGDFPSHVKAPVQYGASVKELITYLSVYQFVPYNRIKDLFAAVFNIQLSEGSVDNVLKEMSEKCDLPYREIRKRIENSPVVGADETGCHVNGKKHWMYIWQNMLLTYIVSSVHRDYSTIEKGFPQGLPKSTIVSDCLSAQLKTPALRHQLCAQAHLMRELANFETGLKSEWSTEFKDVLKQAFDLKQKMTQADYEKPPPEISAIERQVDDLRAVDYSSFHKKLKAFIKRLIKHRNSILTFLYYAEVPADNNGSERGIRNSKVKTKVSGQFRNTQGAQRFAKIRSVIDTAIKNGQPAFPALSALSSY